MTDKEFNLSDKICGRIIDGDMSRMGFYLHTDVKEFIKRLKDELCPHDDVVGEVNIEIIERLAGEKLI